MENDCADSDNDSDCTGDDARGDELHVENVKRSGFADEVGLLCGLLLDVVRLAVGIIDTSHVATMINVTFLPKVFKCNRIFVSLHRFLIDKDNNETNLCNSMDGSPGDGFAGPNGKSSTFFVTAEDAW